MGKVKRKNWISSPTGVSLINPDNVVRVELTTYSLNMFFVDSTSISWSWAPHEGARKAQLTAYYNNLRKEFLGVDK